MKFSPPELEVVFKPGARYRWPDGREPEIEVVDGGMLYLPTGRLVVCDPFWGSEIERQCAPFLVVVEPGRYPVSVSRLRWDQSNHPRIPAPIRRGAAAKIAIRDEPVVKWEMALRPGQDPGELKPGEIFGFGVDAGTGGFFDAAAVAAMGTFVEPDSPEYPRILHDLWENTVLNISLDKESGLNAVLFNCGMGDGLYPTWIGHTAAGEPACFVADLELLSHSMGPIEN